MKRKHETKPEKKQNLFEYKPKKANTKILKPNWGIAQHWSETSLDKTEKRQEQA